MPPNTDDIEMSAEDYSVKAAPAAEPTSNDDETQGERGKDENAKNKPIDNQDEIIFGENDITINASTMTSNDEGETTEGLTFEPTEPTAPIKRDTKQYEYIKSGSRLKTLLSTAFRAMADGLIIPNSDCDNEGGMKRDASDDIIEKNDEGVASKRARRGMLLHAEDLARDKMEECANLKRKIQDLQSQIQALQEENYSSHHTSTQLQSKIDRTLAALQIASTASANARSEADAAEAKVDSLSRQMEEFHSLVEELRRGMDLVRGEHDEVSTIARSVESRLIQVESKLGRATKVTIEAKEERDELKNRAEGAEQKTRLLNEKIDDYEHDIRCLKKGVIEMEELEKIRSERTNRIENELHVTRETLLDATSAAAEAESTVTSLNSVIEELRKENELLHNQISESRDTIHRDRSKQNEALTAVEKEVQKWKLKCEEVQEANRTLKVDKNTAEKQLEQMKSRMANMERRMNDIPRTSSAVTPITSSLGLINCFGAKEISVDSEPRKQLTYVSQLPMRQTSKRSQYDGASRELNYASRSKNFSSSEENNSNDSSNHSRSSSHNTPSFSKRKVTKSNKCCICQQDATGMMKNCQCDNINCDKRAHITCIAKKNEDKCISVSAILCD